MYLPPHFEETDTAVIAQLIAAFPLATIIGNGPQGLVANHIPLLLEGSDILIGHVALANDMHRIIEAGQPVLAIFRSEDSYISPNWYPTKRQHHRHVPTWNYEVVHCEGAISFSNEIKLKRAVVGKMTKYFERQSNGDSAWRMADAPADFMATMLENIVAVQIDITRITAKAKLGQNRDAVDAAGAADRLRSRGQEHLAKRMRAVMN